MTPSTGFTFGAPTTAALSQESVSGASGFSFGTNADVQKDKASDAWKPAFTFGGSAPSSAASEFKFGADKDKPLASTVVASSKPAGFTFGKPDSFVSEATLKTNTATSDSADSSLKTIFSSANEMKSPASFTVPGLISESVTTTVSSEANTKLSMASDFTFSNAVPKLDGTVPISTTESNKKPVFSFGTSNVAKTGGFNFGQAPMAGTSVASTPATTSASSIGSIFGQVASSKPTVNFAFGQSTASVTASTDSNATFTFGKATQVNAANPTFSFKNQDQVQSVSTESTSLPGTFSFNQATSSKAGEFNFSRSNENKLPFAFGEKATNQAKEQQPVFQFGQASAQQSASKESPLFPKRQHEGFWILLCINIYNFKEYSVNFALQCNPIFHFVPI